MARDSYGSGTLFLRGTTWHYSFFVNGRRYQESARTDSEAKARKLLKERMAAVMEGRGAGPRSVRLADLWRGLEADYRLNGRASLKRAGQAWAHVTRLLGNPRAVGIEAADLTRYAADRMDEGATPATVKYELATLRRAFRLAAKVGAVGAVPAFPTISPDNARKVFFTAGEYAAVHARLPEVVADVVQFAYLTGWRRNEILALRWSSVDFAAGVVRVEKTKNHDAREFPFAALPELAAMLTRRAALARLLETGGEAVPYVFHRQGRPVRDFTAVWQRACREAGIPERRILHDFRRTGTRNLVRAGVPRDVARTLTGHKTDSIFTRYNITDDADLREAAGKLAAYHAALAHLTARGA